MARLDDNQRKRIAYLSAHFDDADCRDELRRIIHEVVTKDKQNKKDNA